LIWRVFQSPRGCHDLGDGWFSLSWPYQFDWLAGPSKGGTARLLLLQSGSLRDSLGKDLNAAGTAVHLVQHRAAPAPPWWNSSFGRSTPPRQRSIRSSPNFQSFSTARSRRANTPAIATCSFGLPSTRGLSKGDRRRFPYRAANGQSLLDHKPNVRAEGLCRRHVLALSAVRGRNVLAHLHEIIAAALSGHG